MTKRLFTALTALFFCNTLMFAGNNTFLDYQNYNHGYCPDCNCCPCDCPAVPYQSCPQSGNNCPDAHPYNQNIQPCYPQDYCPECDDECSSCEEYENLPPQCDPSAPVYGAKTGVSICSIGISVLAVGAVAAIIVTANNGSGTTTHTHN